MNTYLTIEMITYEMLMVLHNNTIAGKKVTRKYEKEFAKTGAKIGNQVQIRKPPLYYVTDGATFQAQDYTDLMVPLVVDKHKQIGVEFLNDDMTLSMDDFSGRFLKPALVPLANQVDVDILGNFKLAWNATGTPGTIAATDTPFLDAKTLLVDNSAGDDEWPFLMTPKVDARLSSGLAGRFNPQPKISKLMEEGSMNPTKGSRGLALGWDMYYSQNMPVFTTGAWAGATPTVSGGGQTGSNILTTGWTASVTGLGNQGDVVQFAGVYLVNPVTKLTTSELQNFVLTATVNSDVSGNATLPISPSIIIAGNQQTVNAAPAAGAAITVWGTGTVANVASQVSAQCMGWQNEAITLACVDLAIPGKNQGVDAVRVSDDELGLSILFMRAFDPRQYSNISRLDILYGTTFTRPEHVVRVAS
jgi:hypothetical protein